MMQRRTLWDTFISRHLVFTDGTAPLELDFYVPKRWTKTPTQVQDVTPVKSESSSAAAGASAAAAAHDSTQMWDFTLNEWVPNIMGTEDPTEEAGPKIVVKPTRKKKKGRKKRNASKKKKKQVKRNR